MPRKPKCVTPGCKETDILARGLCRSCYRAAARLVTLKRTTWRSLERKGLSNPPKGHGPKTKAYLAIVGTN